MRGEGEKLGFLLVQLLEPRVGRLQSHRQLLNFLPLPHLLLDALNQNQTEDNGDNFRHRHHNPRQRRNGDKKNGADEDPKYQYQRVGANHSNVKGFITDNQVTQEAEEKHHTQSADKTDFLTLQHFAGNIGTDKENQKGQHSGHHHQYLFTTQLAILVQTNVSNPKNRDDFKNIHIIPNRTKNPLATD